MNRRFRLRLGALLAAVSSLLLLVAWQAHDAWRRSVDLREHFRLVQSESSFLAEHYQDMVRTLDSKLLRAQLHGSSREWTGYQAGLGELEKWLQQQRPFFATGAEIRLFGQIDDEFTRYKSAAQSLASVDRTGPAVADRIALVEKESDAMLSLGFALASAHRTAADATLGRATHALQRIQWLIYVALGMVTCAGAGMGWLVYFGQIAPLRRQLDQSRSQLERHEKLAALGVLSAGIAHEIRNPLAALKARLFTLGKAVRADPSAVEDVMMINGEIDRLERIVRSFLNFSRPPEPVFRTVSPKMLLEHVCNLSAPAWSPRNVSVVVESCEAPALEVDPDQIEQALLNLVQNAAEAMAAGGTIRLATRDGTRLPGGRAGVVLEVADNGPGMSSEVQSRIFDPFFTTKPNGTGLGLSLTARMVERNGGAIQCTTELGQGTTFTLTLPRARP